MKKIFKTLLLIITITLLGSNSIYADDTVYTDGALQYTIDDSGCIRIVYYFGESTVVEIPRAIGLYEKDGDYLPCYVTSIAATTFEDAEITEIKLPDTVVFIEEGAIDSSVKINYYDSYGNIIGKQEEPEPIIITPQEHVDVNEDEIIENSESNFEETDVNEGVFEAESTSTSEQNNEGVIDKEVVENKEIQESKEEIINETKPTNVQTNVSINPNSNYAFIVIGLVVIIVIGYFVYRTIKKKK